MRLRFVVALVAVLLLITVVALGVTLTSQPAEALPPPSNAGPYTIVPIWVKSGVQYVFLLNQQTGATWELKDRRWVRVAGGPEN